MKAEQQYIDLFASNEALICQNSAAALNTPRTKAAEAFERLGFPSLKTEDYKYTDVQEVFAPDYGLNLRNLAIPVNPYDVFKCDVPNLSTSLYFVVNDVFSTQATPKAHLPEGVFAGGLKDFSLKFPGIAAKYYSQAAPYRTDAIVALNTMFVEDGFVLYVPDGISIERPIQLVNIFRSDVDLMANRRILIIVGKNSSARLLVCDHSIDDVNFFANQVVEIFADEDARFDYYDLEDSSSTTVRFSNVYAKQSARSNVLVDGITLVNGLTRNNFNIELNAPGAQTLLCGMSVLDGEQHLDTYSLITHNAPSCTSDELFKNVLNDSSVGSFSGRILVKEEAAGTNANQTNRNLCTTREARMYSKPALEIYAEDVQCSHGMSTGQLDEMALFYMQTRGISLAEAKMMLSIAFTDDVINNVRLDVLKERLRVLVEKRFRGELSKCSGCGNCR